MQKTNFSDPLRQLSEEEAERMGLNYYDSNVHRSCFIWPRYVKKVQLWFMHEMTVLADTACLLQGLKI